VAERMSEILLTCGIGDFIAMESYFTQAERDQVAVIHWATRARSSLMQLVPFVFTTIDRHVIERDTWGPAFSKDFSIASRDELPDLDGSVVDWNVHAIVEQVWAGKRAYATSSLITQPLCSVAHLNLPERYCVVHPYSENARTPVRDFSTAEWLAVYGYWSAREMPIVVVNKGGERFPSLPGVIDLTDNLDLLAAIEVTKGACGFAGTASVFSVVASKVLPKESLFIKGGRDLRENYSSFYYAPHTSNCFIADDLIKICHGR
jgi:hypothetical protein